MYKSIIFRIHMGKYSLNLYILYIDKVYFTKYFGPQLQVCSLTTTYIVPPHKHIHPPEFWEQKMVWQVNKESNNGQIDLLFDFRRLKEWVMSNKKDVCIEYFKLNVDTLFPSIITCNPQK